MKRILLPIFALLLAAAAGAEIFTVDVGHSDVSFQVRHLVAKTRGVFRAFEGTIELDRAKPESSQVRFSIDVKSIDTGNENRDEHLRSADFFDVAKFPQITFVGRKIQKTGEGRFDVTGDFSLHGVTKSLTLPVAYTGVMKDPWGGERAGFELSATIDRKAFGIVWNKALDQGGTVLGDDIAVTISLETMLKKPEPKPVAN